MNKKQQAELDELVELYRNLIDKRFSKDFLYFRDKRIESNIKKKNVADDDVKDFVKGPDYSIPLLNRDYVAKLKPNERAFVGYWLSTYLPTGYATIMSYGDIAAIVGLSRQSVKNIYDRAIKKAQANKKFREDTDRDLLE